MRKSFTVQYAAHLWVAALGVTGPLGALLTFVVSILLGDMADRGIVVIDITIDKLKEALKDKQWRSAAEKAYEKATAKVYSEGEKDAIRQQYLEALKRYATYGNGMR